MIAEIPLHLARKCLINALIIIGASACLLFFALYSSHTIIANLLLYFYKLIHSPFDMLGDIISFFTCPCVLILFTFTLHEIEKEASKKYLRGLLEPYISFCIAYLIVGAIFPTVMLLPLGFGDLNFSLCYRALIVLLLLFTPYFIVISPIVFLFLSKIIITLNRISREYIILDSISMRPLKYSILCFVFITTELSFILLFLRRLDEFFQSYFYSYIIFCICFPTLLTVSSGLFVEYPMLKIEKINIFPEMRINEVSKIVRVLIRLLEDICTDIGAFLYSFKRSFSLINKLCACPTEISKRYSELLNNIGLDNIELVFKEIKSIERIINILLLLIITLSSILFVILFTIPSFSNKLLIINLLFLPMIFLALAVVNVYGAFNGIGQELLQKLNVSENKFRSIIALSILKILYEILDYIEQELNRKIVLGGITKGKVAQFMSRVHKELN